MPSIVDYDKHYRKGPKQCGDPFPEILSVLAAWPFDPPAEVLDLGCGQGRDALTWARAGHRVVGVDLSEVGITQMTEEARRDGLAVVGVVDDIVHYRRNEPFDVVIIDRALHLVPDDRQRLQALRNAEAQTRAGGLVLIVDTPSNIPLIRQFIEASGRWCWVYRRGAHCFAQKVVP